MRADFSMLSGVLYCPDDGKLLNCERLKIDCPDCGRVFPVTANRTAELLPSRPTDVSLNRHANYWQAYRHAFRESFRKSEDGIAWGAAEVNARSWVANRLRQTRAVEGLLGDYASNRQQILCDVSAGAGHYTLAYSQRFRIVLNCDLSVDNLNYVVSKARMLGLQNIFFLRTDYFAMPFRSSVDRILCLDTLIRGEVNELAVLKSIRRVLAPEGGAVVDFHNWWHNPMRRLGLLRDNFHGNRSYTAKESRNLMSNVGVTRFDLFRFHQEFDADNRYQAFPSRVVPATRLLFRFDGVQPCEC